MYQNAPLSNYQSLVQKQIHFTIRKLIPSNISQTLKELQEAFICFCLQQYSIILRCFVIMVKNVPTALEIPFRTSFNTCDLKATISTFSY